MLIDVDGVTEEARLAYHKNGFGIIPGGVSGERVEMAIAAIEDIQARVNDLPAALTEKLVMERDLPARKRGGIEPHETGDAIFIVNDLPVVLPELAALLIDSVLVGIVRRFLVTEDIRYHFSNVTMKRGRIGSGISWHRDFPNQYICPKRSSFLRMMVCLDGMDGENGVTQFVEGSHLISDEEAVGAVSSLAAADPQAVVSTACCGPGSLVLIHPKCVHGGAPNVSARHRRNVIVQWGRGDDPVPVEPGIAETWTGFSVQEIERWTMMEMKA